MSIYKYADTGIAETLRKLHVFGGMKSRLTARIAGGASMVSGQQFSALGNIGQRNIQAVKSILYQSGVRILGEDTGSDYARTMMLSLIHIFPFLLIDMVTASILMSMGMVMLPPAMISLPFKLLLFIAVDGWELLFSSIVKSFY